MTPRASGNYAFLNHSAVTLPNNLPPNVDDKPLARQKRKRTSPEDQATLEAAYNSDPKPDKAARLELVKQVALGEKEVQIWFQNRRQTSRRKSRPLLPHEIAQYQLSRFGMSSDSLSIELTSSSELGEETSQIPRTNQAGQIDLENQSFVKEPERPASSEISTVDATNSTPSDAVEAPTDRQRAVSHSAQLVPELSEAPRPTVTKPSLGPIGYLANRQSLPSFHTRQDVSKDDHKSTDADAVLRKTSSIVRLSMTSEGNAQVITKDTSSPSPPRVPPIPQLSDGSGQQPPPPSGGLSSQVSDLPSANRQHRSSSGRSRDSRAWEFWCDKDTRTELEDKAEKDASGSAADAIDLLRSTSGRSILGVVPSKRNSLLSRHASFLKRSRVDAKPASLLRSTTSFGRLQGEPAGEMKSTPKLKHSDSGVAVYIPGNESDKENWSPDTDTPSDGHPAVEVYSASQRQLARTWLSRPKRSLSNVENAGPEVDPEVAAFMRGSRKSTSISEEDDMDCVQGLLSLSQGNWR